MSAITRYLAMLRLFGMLLCAAAIPSVATATVPVTVAVAASDVEEEAVEASAVGAEAEAARDAGYESAEVPALARRVTDLTATLDAAERARLEASLAALEARKGAQVAILMVPSTYPDSIEAYATRVFEAWKLGRKGIDDGVLVLVAKDDRRMRIEVGYGLEGTITDIDAGRIIREYMTPAFRQQDYAGGLEAAAQRLVRLIDGEALPPPPRDPLEPGAVRQTLAIAFLLGALGGVALLVRPRAWYWTLGAVVALAAALALGRHWPAGAMVALAEMVAVLGVGFGALLKYSRGARWFFAILVLYALGLFWAYRRYGLPVLHYGLAVPLSLGLTLLMLDVLFTFNIALSIVVLLVCVYALRPLDFAVFPTILLVATLLRLALNVASTRVVLLHGHDGHGAAGKVIQAFGEVVIGGNYVVGVVVFAILMIINFVVVTKGAGRISEVSARFTLDAMPGKQMAIDADLNAGLIEQEEAKKRRSEVAQEADFYGSMDGASKFVRGDAIAGLLILFINLIGGVAIGMIQHSMSFGDAGKVYALLTIGDGLVAQLPSLLLSTAAAIMVTRVSSSEDMGQQVNRQMFASPKALAISAAILIAMGAVPGMPHVSFIGLGALAGAAAYWIWHRQNKAKQVAEQEVQRQQELLPAQRAQEVKELGWDDVTPVDMVGLEVGYRLIPLVDRNQGGQLLARIKGVRKKLSQELGFLMPSVHIRDNLDLLPNAYRLTLMGVSVAEAEIYPDRELAINPGQVFGSLNGIAGKDPAFGLEAVWIEPGQRDQAQSLGYTVVDASTVVATHLNQVLHKHAHELLGHEEVQQLLQLLARSSPKLAEELVPGLISLSTLLKVLQALLQEQVPVRDIRTIAEAIANVAPRSQDPGAMVAAVRVALSRAIVQSIVGLEPELPVITLEPRLEQILLNSMQKAGQGSEDGMLLEPGMAEKLQRSLIESAQRQEMLGKPAILLVAGPIRSMMSRFARMAVPSMHVLAYQEIPDNKQVTIVATVGQN